MLDREGGDLPEPSVLPKRENEQCGNDGSPERDSALDDDYALNEALNVLKGLHLARERSGTKPKG